MKKSIYQITLDIHKDVAQHVLHCKKNDSGRSIHITLIENGKPYVLEGITPVFTGVKPDKKGLYNECQVEGNKIIYDMTEQTTNVVGQIPCELQVFGRIDGRERLITSPKFIIIVDDTVYNDEEIASSEESSALTALIVGAAEAISGAEAAITEMKKLNELVATDYANGNFNGKGISKIEKTGTVGITDTYTVTFTDNSTFQYTVTNGKGEVTDETLRDAIANYLAKNPIEGGGSGTDGKSAYEIAVDLGFDGSKEEWIESLRGKDGKDGAPGEPGADGLSAYAVWLAQGNTGTEADFLESLKGEQGEQGEGFSGSLSMRIAYDGNYTDKEYVEDTGSYDTYMVKVSDAVIDRASLTSAEVTLLTADGKALKLSVDENIVSIHDFNIGYGLVYDGAYPFIIIVPTDLDDGTTKGTYFLHYLNTSEYGYTISYPTLLVCNNIHELYESLQMRMKGIESAVDYREADDEPPVLTWTINTINDSTGATSADNQKMRIVSIKVALPKGTVINFGDSSTYPYQLYFYDYSTGEYLAEEMTTSWDTGNSYLIENDRQVVIKVRHKSYTTWTDESVATYAETVTISLPDPVSLKDRVSTVEESVLALSDKVDEIEVPESLEIEDSLIKQVFGEQEPKVPVMVWNIGNITSDGTPTTDTQSMRIICNKITLSAAATINFANASTYYWQCRVFDLDGNQIVDECSNYDAETGALGSSWQSASTFEVQAGRQIIIVVREKSYKVWTDELITAYAETVTFTMYPVEGLINRVATLEAKADAVDALKEEIDFKFNGDTAEAPSFTWIIRSSNTNYIDTDTVITNLPLSVVFPNNSIYRLYINVYDLKGNVLSDESYSNINPATVSTFAIARDRKIQIAIKYYNSNTKWTEDTLSAFTSTVEVTANPEIGFIERLENVETSAAALEEISKHVNGDPDDAVAPTLTWTIRSSNTNYLDSDTVTTDIPINIVFPNASTYRVYVNVYDLDGNVLEDESLSYVVVSTFAIARDRKFSLTIKYYNSNTKWTEDTVASYNESLKITAVPAPGLVERVKTLEGNINLVPSIQTKVDENTAAIKGIKETLETFEGGSGGSESNVLLEYDANFFETLENGEISWSNGQDVEGNSTLYVRSVGYSQVNASGGLLVAKIPSTAMVSYYTYSRDIEGNYIWESASEWMAPNSTFSTIEGKYYRVLVYNAGAEISPDTVNVVLSGSLVQDIIDAVVAQYQTKGTSTELDEELSVAETTELNSTIASLKSLITPNTVQIAWHTDLHISANENTTTEESVRTYSSGIRKHITMFNKICDSLKVDMMVLGGDYLNNTKSTLKDGALLSYGILREYIEGARASIPKAVCTGNHDDNTLHAYNNSMDATNYVGILEQWDLLHGIQSDDMHRDADNLERAYGYYDIPNRKIRVFFLNTVDVPFSVDESSNQLNYTGQYDTGFRQEQLQFVAEHLKFDESGWQVIFFQHHPMTVNTDKQTSVGVKADRGGDSMREIIAAFTVGGSGTAVCETADFESSVDYDFSDNKSNTVIACVSGHTHGHETNAFDGIQVITTPAVLEGNSIYFVIDRKNRKLHLICNSATASSDKAGTDITYSY